MKFSTNLIRWVLVGCFISTFSYAENVGIVQRQGNQFVLNGTTFYYAGDNNYYQMVYAADAGLRYAVDEVMEETNAMGMTVMRTWAFNDGASQWNALQISPGVYDETVFQGLDYVLYKADQEGIRLILPLVNNWDDYGGMNQYVAWADSAYTRGCSGFIGVNGTHFEVNGRTYYYVGMNFWHGLNLASTGAGGDRDRLLRELDLLRSIGITNLRIMAGTEGPDSEPWRMVPSLQTSPGVYNNDVLDGLDYLVFAAKARGIRLVMCLNNFWHWSGGMAQYVNWNGGGPIPYPPPEPGGNWDDFQDYSSDFYSNSGAILDFQDHISFILNRINPFTGIAYKDEPAIMSWELGNEPRGWNNNTANFNIWIDNTAAFIKSIDPNHLVATGCEGDTPWSSWNGLDFVQNQNGPDIDYTTIHIWPQNWGWFDPSNASGTYPTAETNARAYFNDHEADAVNLGKPMVLEEFGLARDNGSYDPSSTTSWRDTFYADMYDEVYTSASGNGPAGGSNVWSWAGEGRPLVPYGSYWNPGDPWIGDPPHEQQGWYSIYDTDSSTFTVISTHEAQLETLLGSGNHDDFYDDALCNIWYQNHCSEVLNRVNTHNGRLYREDPTVFAWELANEPETTSDASGDLLQSWIEAMSINIKSVDSLHMVTTGSEGFYGQTGPAHNPSSWMGNKGVDFIRNHQPESIDFACYHAWPDWWGMNLTNSINWAYNHIQDTENLLSKPVILEEYGKQQPMSTREQYFQGWLDEIETSAGSGGCAAGSNLWILYHDDYPDYDGFGIYYPAHISTISLLEDHTDYMNSLNATITQSVHFFESGWHMTSLPLEPEYTQIDSVFGDDIAGTYFIYDYSSSNGYSEVSEIQTGYGYWLALEDTATVDMYGSIPADSLWTDLHLHWNITGHPQMNSTHKTSLLFSDGVSLLAYEDAVNSGWIGSAVYQFDNSLNSYTLTDSLFSWFGYWLQALVDNLQIVNVQSSQGYELKRDDVSDDEDDWFLQVLITLGSYSDQLAGFGAHFEATDAYDPWYDLPAPPTPPSGDYVRLVFEHAEWGAPVGDLFSHDVRATLDSNSTKTWDGILEASEAGIMTVDFGDIAEVLPSGYTITAALDTIVFDPAVTPIYSFEYSEPETLIISVSNFLSVIEDLTLTIDQDNVILNWEDIAFAQMYYIYRCTEAYFQPSTATLYDSVSVSNYTDNNALIDENQFYRVTYRKQIP